MGRWFITDAKPCGTRKLGLAEATVISPDVDSLRTWVYIGTMICQGPPPVRRVQVLTRARRMQSEGAHGKIPT